MTRLWTACAALGVAALAVAAFASAHALTAPPLLENVTPSLPIGLYRHVTGEAKPGAVVAIRQPAAARGYLRSLGFPAEALLLKRVVTTSGAVCARPDDVVAGARTFGRVARDRLGASLPHWEGCRPLGDGELFVAGDDGRSFDSRYFGPVPASSVVGIYERLR